MINRAVIGCQIELKPAERGQEAAGAAGEHQEVFLPTVGTPDEGEATARVAAVEVALDDFSDNRPQVALILLEAALIFCQKPAKVMK